MQNKQILKIFLILFLLPAIQACDFFGRKNSQNLNNTSQTTLASGQSVLGAWTTLYVSADNDNRNPQVAIVETFEFDQTQTAKITLSDLHKNGISCFALGSYRISQNDVIIYVQSQSGCNFSNVIQLNNVVIDKLKLSYFDSQNYQREYFKAKYQNSNALVGVWDFHNQGADEKGEGGFENIIFEPHGYFTVQTKIQGNSQVYLGTYVLTVDGGVLLNFFSTDPQTPYLQMSVHSYLTNGITLNLNFLESDNSITTYTGDRL
jgi:hypothetical protein